MSGIKKLAGQTLWYGLSSIVAKFINYLLTPYLTLKLTGPDYGELSVTYAAIPFFSVIFTYGMETAFFRFSTQNQHKKDVFNTASLSLICSTILFTAILVFFNDGIASLLKIQLHPEYITLMSFIIAFDTLSALPLAKLRLDGRPVKYAFVRIGGILLNIAVLYFFISVAPDIVRNNPHGLISKLYKSNWQLGYVLVANLCQTIFTLLLLWKEFFSFQFKFNSNLWKTMLIYSFPLTIAGFGGMINEVFDRIMLQWWYPSTSVEEAKFAVGTYSACYKLAILITLSIQAFRMGAEPFFFKQAAQENAPKTYARTMKFFVITLSAMFLFVMLYIEIWKHFISQPKMWEGLKVVPILLFANIFLGIYYNLSIWYKIKNKTTAGAVITIAGAFITLAISYIFIPLYGYMACAWATFCCYGFMMLLSYAWGQKVYPIPYNLKKILSYLFIALALYLLHHYLVLLHSGTWFNLLIATFLMIVYFVIVGLMERKELKALPVIGKYF